MITESLPLKNKRISCAYIANISKSKITKTRVTTSLTKLNMYNYIYRRKIPIGKRKKIYVYKYIDTRIYQHYL